MPKLKPIKERFLAKIRKTKSCWLWTASKNHRGYGMLQQGRRGGRPLQAHRVAWEIYFGEIPEGLMVLHKCDNRACVRPAHLFTGTAKNNTEDMISKGRGWWQCESRSPRPKLGLDDYRFFIEVWQESSGCQEVADKTGKSRNACAVLAAKLRRMGANLKHMPKHTRR